MLLSCFFLSHENRLGPTVGMNVVEESHATERTVATNYVTRKVAAAELGFSRQRLEALIKEGRIDETPEGIDIAKAREAFLRTVDIARQAGYRMRSGAKAVRAKVGKADGAGARKRGARRPPPVSEEEGGLFDYAKSRAERELWNAKQAEAKYKEKVGELISVEAVRKREFEIGRMARDRILGWPHRFVGQVSHDVMARLVDEAEALCRELQQAVLQIDKDLPL